MTTRACPCDLTQSQIEKFNKVDNDLRCTAPRLDDETLPCGELLAKHPKDSSPSGKSHHTF